MYFDDATDSTGKTYKVDNSTAPVLLKSKDKVLRKTTFESRMKAFEKLNKTFAELYIKDIELDKFNYKLIGYLSLAFLAISYYVFNKVKFKKTEQYKLLCLYIITP